MPPHEGGAPAEADVDEAARILQDVQDLDDGQLDDGQLDDGQLDDAHPDDAHPDDAHPDDDDAVGVADLVVRTVPTAGAEGAPGPPCGDATTSGPALRREVSDEVGRTMAAYRRRAVVLDATSAVVASLGTVAVRFHSEVVPGYVALSALLPVAWVGVLSLQRTYEQRFLGSGTEEYRRVADSAVVLFTLLAVMSFVWQANLSRGYALAVVPVTLALTLVGRRSLRGWLFRVRGRGHGKQRVLVVGRADAATSVVEKLVHEPEHGLVPVAACVPSVAGVSVSHLRDVPVVGDPGRILDVVDKLGVHVVAVVSHPDLSGHALRRLAWALEERDVELVVSPGIIEVAGPRLSIRPIAGLSLLHLERPTITGTRRVLKGLTDRLLGLAFLVFLSPVLLVVALAVKLSSPGPVLYRQTRIGAGGKPFTMYKFRSMVVDADRLLPELAHLDDGNGVLFKVRNDPRVTPVGALMRRYSLDELPQLLNVLKGEMSLVGPRPPLPDEVARYDDDAARRLRVRPGLTGLWQVSGRSDLSWEESLLLDLRYVDNWSMTLDAVILWRTGRAVLRGSGAY